MQYKNNKMLADFDKTINELQKKSEKELAAKQKASEKKSGRIEAAPTKDENK